MYSIAAYGTMIADKGRMGPYLQALRQAVKPGSVVVDIGTGTGIFALLACQMGARKVYAIEPDDAIQVARELAAVNGYADRIQFIQKRSTQVELPERAEVIVSDLRGILPIFQSHLPAIVDARTRFLAPAGVMIPQRDTLWVAVVEAAELHKEYAAPWGEDAYGLDMRAVRNIVINTWGKGRTIPSDHMLVEPQCWATLDYTRLVNFDVAGEAQWSVTRAGLAHGLLVWFDTVLLEGIEFSNRPGHPELIYGRAFFPWPEPVSLAVNDTLSVSLHANLVGEDYIWRWNTQVLSQASGGQVKAEFKQSTFYGAPLSPERLRRCEAGYCPRLNQEGRLDRVILTLMNGDLSLDQITRQVMEQFPRRFTSWKEALAYVGELSQKYSM